MELMELAAQCCACKQVVCLVGGGGKTTLMYWLARQCAQMGKQVLVGTTTHILHPEEAYAQTLSQAHQLWAEGRYAVIGTPASHGKLTAAPKELYLPLAEEADLILLEADGSKRLPCKLPALHEPVISEDCTLILGVMGMSALGMPLKECCFRFASEGSWLTAEPETVLDEALAAAILSDRRGTRKGAENRPYMAVLNQCDDTVLLSRAKNIRHLLEAQGIPSLLCHFSPAERLGF